jgi:hypothetical protein
MTSSVTPDGRPASGSKNKTLVLESVKQEDFNTFSARATTSRLQRVPEAAALENWFDLHEPISRKTDRISERRAKCQRQEKCWYWFRAVAASP